MASLALALCARPYGLHKLPEHLKSETGLLLIHRPFAPMPSCPQFSLPTPGTHDRVHYGYGYGAVRCGASGAVRCTKALVICKQKWADSTANHPRRRILC